MLKSDIKSSASATDPFFSRLDAPLAVRKWDHFYVTFLEK